MTDPEARLDERRRALLAAFLLPRKKLAAVLSGPPLGFMQGHPARRYTRQHTRHLRARFNGNCHGEKLLSPRGAALHARGTQRLVQRVTMSQLPPRYFGCFLIILISGIETNEQPAKALARRRAFFLLRYRDQCFPRTCIFYAVLTIHTQHFSCETFFSLSFDSAD